MEFFVVSNSFAAPFVSDTWSGFFHSESDNPHEALLEFISTYKHPAGLFCAYLYKDANDYHRNEGKPLAKFLSPQAQEQI